MIIATVFFMISVCEICFNLSLFHKEAALASALIVIVACTVAQRPYQQPARAPRAVISTHTVIGASTQCITRAVCAPAPVIAPAARGRVLLWTDRASADKYNAQRRARRAAAKTTQKPVDIRAARAAFVISELQKDLF